MDALTHTSFLSLYLSSNSLCFMQETAVSIHVVEQLLFPIVPLILTFDFDLILGSFLTFWGPNGLNF